MINSVDIRSFKSLEDEKLEFKNLTVLSGTNSSGKSSTIQAILLYALEINRDYISPLSSYFQFLKYGNELINFNIRGDIYISINGSASLEFSKGDDRFELIGDISDELKDILDYQNGNLIYLSADRIGARDIYPINRNPLDKIGIGGEYAISYYEANKSSPIDENLRIDKNHTTLEENISYWLGEIVNSEIRTETIVGTDYIKASFAYKSKTKNQKFVKPRNIGSGTSYLVSILIASLSAKQNSVIIIENPEIHLHPKAQAKLGEFFAFIASNGVQIIIETHNDHIINRLRYEVYKGYLKSSDIVIYYKESDTSFEKVEIGENGKFINKNGENSFPKGFYDATLKEIYSINRGR